MNENYIRESVIRQLEMEGELLKYDEKQTSEEYPSEAVESPVTAPYVTRESILDDARLCVCGCREADYGSPEDNFQLIAHFWDIYLRFCDIEEHTLKAEDVANMMILLKIARNVNGSKLDNWIDIAGYAACGGEIKFGIKGD